MLSGSEDVSEDNRMLGDARDRSYGYQEESQGEEVLFPKQMQTARLYRCNVSHMAVSTCLHFSSNDSQSIAEDPGGAGADYHNSSLLASEELVFPINDYVQGTVLDSPSLP